MKTKRTRPAVQRSRPHKTLEALRQAAMHHELISEYMPIAMQDQALFESPHPIKKIKGMKSFLATRVVKHFKYEEDHVFPKLQVAARVVGRLIREHKTMLAEVGILQKKLDQMTATSSAKDWKGLQAAFGDLLRMLLKHTLEEDFLYQKQREALAACRFVTEQLHLRCGAKAK
jgi:hemerythrin superfamily protein